MYKMDRDKNNSHKIGHQKFLAVDLATFVIAKRESEKVQSFAFLEVTLSHHKWFSVSFE